VSLAVYSDEKYSILINLANWIRKRAATAFKNYFFGSSAQSNQSWFAWRFFIIEVEECVE